MLRPFLNALVSDKTIEKRKMKRRKRRIKKKKKKKRRNRAHTAIITIYPLWYTCASVVKRKAGRYIVEKRLDISNSILKIAMVGEGGGG